MSGLEEAVCSNSIIPESILNANSIDTILRILRCLLEGMSFYSLTEYTAEFCFT